MTRFYTVWHYTTVLVLLLFATTAHAQSGGGANANAPKKSPLSLTVMLGTQGALHSADMLTTAYSLSHGGQAREGNPLLAPFSKHPMALAAVSTSINALQIYTIAKVNVHHPKLARTWALILIGAESFAVVNNLKMAGRISKQLP